MKTDQTAGISKNLVPATSERRSSKAFYACQTTDPTHDQKACKGQKKVINEVSNIQEQEENPPDYMEFESSGSSEEKNSEAYTDAIERFSKYEGPYS